MEKDLLEMSRQVVLDYPNCIEAYLARARLLLAMGKFKQAIPYYQEVSPGPSLVKLSDCGSMFRVG
jgi:tetratricopeptide (TPR) repeat protein